MEEFLDDNVIMTVPFEYKQKSVWMTSKENVDGMVIETGSLGDK